jgi:hypothetical protein
VRLVPGVSRLTLQLDASSTEARSVMPPAGSGDHGRIAIPCRHPRYRPPMPTAYEPVRSPARPVGLAAMQACRSHVRQRTRQEVHHPIVSIAQAPLIAMQRGSLVGQLGAANRQGVAVRTTRADGDRLSSGVSVRGAGAAPQTARFRPRPAEPSRLTARPAHRPQTPHRCSSTQPVQLAPNGAGHELVILHCCWPSAE